MRTVLLSLLVVTLAFSAPLVGADPFTLKDKAVKKLTLADPPADDNRLVPGWRAGPLFLGMTTAQLLAAAGRDPDKTFAEGYHFAWGGTYVQTLSDGKVTSIGVGWNNTSSTTKTIEGLGIGSSQLAVAAALGQPEWRNNASEGLYYCYERGIIFQFDAQSRTNGIYIVTKARAKWVCSDK